MRSHTSRRHLPPASPSHSLLPNSYHHIRQTWLKEHRDEKERDHSSTSHSTRLPTIPSTSSRLSSVSSSPSCSPAASPVPLPLPSLPLPPLPSPPTARHAQTARVPSTAHSTLSSPLHTSASISPSPLSSTTNASQQQHTLSSSSPSQSATAQSHQEILHSLLQPLASPPPSLSVPTLSSLLLSLGAALPAPLQHRLHSAMRSGSWDLSCLQLRARDVRNVVAFLRRAHVVREEYIEQLHAHSHDGSLVISSSTLSMCVSTARALAALDLSKNALNDQGIEELLGMLGRQHTAVQQQPQHQSSIDSLHLSDTTWFQQLSPLISLQELKLRGCHLTPRAYQLLFQRLSMHSVLQRIDLSAGEQGKGLHFIGDACTALGHMFQANTTLQHIHLNNVGIGYVPDGLQAAINGLKNNHSLRLLNIADNALQAADLAFLRAGSLGNITHLNISHNNIGSVGLSHLCRAFQGSSLQKLDVSSCGIGGAGLTVLSATVERAPELHTVLLRGNFISSSWAGNAHDLLEMQAELAAIGTGWVSSSLNNSVSITTLTLSKCSLDDTVLSELCTALHHHCSLTTLHLSHNRIGDVGAQALASLLQRNSIISTVTLALNTIGDEGGVAIAKAISALTTQNSALTHLDLQSNSLQNASAHAFLYAITQNVQLIRLDLSGNKIDFSYFDKLAERAHRNHRIYSSSITMKQAELIATLLDDRQRLIATTAELNEANIELNALQAQLKLSQEQLPNWKHEQTQETERTLELYVQTRRESSEFQSELSSFSDSLRALTAEKDAAVSALSNQLDHEKNNVRQLTRKQKKHLELLKTEHQAAHAGSAEASRTEVLLASHQKKLIRAKHEYQMLEQSIQEFIEALEVVGREEKDKKKVTKKKPLRIKVKSSPRVAASPSNASSDDGRDGDGFEKADDTISKLNKSSNKNSNPKSSPSNKANKQGAASASAKKKSKKKK